MVNKKQLTFTLEEKYNIKSTEHNSQLRGVSK